MTRPYTPWSHEEDAALLRLRAAGKTNKQISGIIGRSHCAVCSRVTRSNLAFINTAPLPEAPPRIRIQQYEVVDHYERGWRFIGFERGLCVFEWPHASAPMLPAEKRQAA